MKAWKKYKIYNTEEWDKMNVRDKLDMIVKWVDDQDRKDVIDYRHIIKLLRTNNINDFNMFPDIHNYWDLLDLQVAVDNAYNNEAPLIQRNCKDCGQVFHIYISERDDYIAKKLQLPKRCKKCRQLNKQKKAV